MLNTLLIATDGLPVGGRDLRGVYIVSADFLTITAASRGLLQPEVVDALTMIVDGGEGGGITGTSIARRKLPARLAEKIGRDIHKDDEEVLELLTELIISGILE